MSGAATRNPLKERAMLRIRRVLDKLKALVRPLIRRVLKR